jgi:O-antigen ligase
LALATVVASLHGVWQHFSGLDLVHEKMLVEMLSGYRAQGTLTNVLTFGGVFTVIGLFFLPLASNESGWRHRLLASSSVLALLAASLSYSRSTQLAIAVAILLSLTLLWRLLRWRTLLLPAIFAALLVTVQPDALFRFGRENPGAKPHESIADQAGSRREIWLTAVNVYSRYPILGVGQGNFLEVYDDYAPPDAIARHAVAHSDLLAVAVSRGTAGLIAYILIWVALVRHLLSRYRRLVPPPVAIAASAGLVMIAGYLIMSQFEAFFQDEEVRLTLLFLLGALFARLRLDI